MQASEEERDDLTKITGIGRARQLWLAERFGVHTYDDLAALSADDIETQFKAENKPYSRSETEHWPQEAAELAAKKAQLSIRTTAESSVSEIGNSPANEIQPNEPQPKEAMAKRSQGGQWKPVATFIVEFQTRRTKDQVIEQRTKVNYHDTDQQVVWPGVESERIGRWMVEQAGDKLHQEIQEVPAVEPEAELVTEAALPVRLSVTVTDLRIYQPAGAEISLALGKNGQPYAGVIRAGYPFAVEADFEIGEQATAVIGEREILYRAQFYTQNRSTRDKVHLGDAEPGSLFSGKANYSAMLSGIALPPGTYRLQIVVIAESENVVPGYLKLPMLRVV